ncbi:TPA: PTS-dependent dihydroxyacetone kinase phosphotransferase subunit DhaM [Streptococcus pneumoniae]|nr:PTS-dependent dihydroxyacetone kinase phosphotransferase subunit DhaM [Streptococcus pneumoniae]HEV6168080.1 PTS-dependent dihydroxyacetone kinase phosphotransferase subunit DhaM [Streptococcus pneumoniae]HEV6173897.1 PTS-dependent dihydroxyacetone kinase phosphotransferase subunit DhaM [Streptococcus pneumoniae]HEV6213176.1 PTS-dependent dihydroxyacetone kinase phosphotransferase subunit DhaM [Streptococcus pneumoniae]HEV6362698.1 PTS-dependent dihydroxyacetone kinase phosphotransferase sub
MESIGIGIGIVIVSHSKHIAEGVVELISKVAKDVPITYVGGTEGGGIGTSFDQVDRVVSENPADTLLVFFDLGSAKMNLKMVTDFSDKSIIINRVPIVEGAYNAAALLQAGAELSVIQIQLAELEINK